MHRPASAVPLVTMQFNILFFITLAVFGADMAVAASCNNRQIIRTTDLPAQNGGPVIQVRSFKCMDAINHTVDSSEGARELEERDDIFLEERTDSRCTANVCFCGVGCIFQGCGPVTQPIRGSDCNTIISALAATPGTFTIQAGDGIGFAFESCEYTLFSPQGTQQCFSDMSTAAANIFAVCGSSNTGDCKMVSGSITGFVDQVSL